MAESSPPTLALWNRLRAVPGGHRLFSAAMVAMIGWYIGVTAKTLPGLRPEDDRYGHIDQISGHYGHFAPYSWWPLWLALAAAVVFLGVAMGWWIVYIGSVFLVFAVIGWVYEYFSGAHHV